MACGPQETQPAFQREVASLANVITVPARSLPLGEDRIVPGPHAGDGREPGPIRRDHVTGDRGSGRDARIDSRENPGLGEKPVPSQMSERRTVEASLDEDLRQNRPGSSRSDVAEPAARRRGDVCQQRVVWTLSPIATTGDRDVVRFELGSAGKTVGRIPFVCRPSG